MKQSMILGTGSALPANVVSNKDLEQRVETTDEWIVERTGIRSRHIATTESPLTLAEEASRKAIAAADLTAADIDMIVVGTTTADKLFPSLACELQAALGAPMGAAFDVQAACAGFVYALSVADQYIKTGQAKQVLVVGAECLSRLVDWSDRSTCILFGDGAGAVVLGESSSEQGILHSALHANGNWGPLLYVENMNSAPEKEVAKRYIHMQGNKVFKLAVTKLGEMVETTLAEQNLNAEDIDWLVPHQANLRIIQATADRLDCPMDRVIVTVDQHGNTSAASIPLALDHGIQTGQIKRGQLLLLETFGGGLAWGSALIRY